MLIDFFYSLKNAGIPVSIDEFLYLLEALQRKIIRPTLDDLYVLARVTLIKNEQHFDRFDQIFAKQFRETISVTNGQVEIPAKWLARLPQELNETPAKTAPINEGESLPATGEGAGIDGRGQSSGNGNQSATKKRWEERIYREHDPGNRIDHRNMNIALRKLRKYSRAGMGEEELNLDMTLRDTADNAGMLKIRMQPERKNRFKVLVLLDIGGTMFEHAALTTELFTAARSEFRNMDFFYFHNCIYEHVWRKHWQREETYVSTWDIIHRYAQDTRLIFIGDAKMAATEILQIGGSLLHRNEESGKVWLERLVSAYPNFVWLNPEPEESWNYRESITTIRDIMQHRMFPLTIEGLEQGMRLLSK